MPRCGDEGRGQMPRPGGSSPSNTTAFFCINQWIKRSIFQYFNAAVRLQGQQDVLIDSGYIYFFIFCFLKAYSLRNTKTFKLWQLLGRKNWFLTWIHVHVHMHKYMLSFHTRTLLFNGLLWYSVVSARRNSFFLLEHSLFSVALKN